MAARTYGSVSPEQQKAMSGLEFVKGLASGTLPLNTMAQTLGYDGGSRKRPRRSYGHPEQALTSIHGGTVHGGLTAILLDSCMGLAIKSMLERGLASTTLEFKISLVHAITLETARLGPRASAQLRPPGRHGRRARYQRSGLLARARHDDVPHFSELAQSTGLRATPYPGRRC